MGKRREFLVREERWQIDDGDRFGLCEREPEGIRE